MLNMLSKPREAQKWQPPEVDLSLFSLPKLNIEKPHPWEEDSREVSLVVRGEVADVFTGRPIPLVSVHRFPVRYYDGASTEHIDDAFKHSLRQHLINMATHEIDEALFVAGRRVKNPHPEDPSYIDRPVRPRERVGKDFLDDYRREYMGTLSEPRRFDGRGREVSRAERAYLSGKQPEYDCLTGKLLGYR